MGKVTKKCRVCGEEYTACLSLNRKPGTFRWQEVACSPLCGSIYLAKIEESRRVVVTPVEEAIPEDEIITSYEEDETEDFDDFDDEEEEDEDEEDEF